MGYFYDSTYILVILSVLLAFGAQIYVNSVYSKFVKRPNAMGMTGMEAARRILDNNGLSGVQIREIPGKLTDAYDPRQNTLYLSSQNYRGTSIAAVTIAAHECGHAIQDEESYAPLVIRGKLVPVANFCSRIAFPLVLLGMILSYNTFFMQIGIWAFAFAVFLQIVTLPVEFNASRRAMQMTEQLGVLQTEELGKGKKVLRAAAYTYVAALAVSLLQLLRLVLLARGGRRRK